MRTRVSLRFYGVLALAGLLTFLLHEAAHWGMGTALGYQMTFGLNGSAPSTPMSATQAMLTDAAGPAVTVLQALVAAWLVQTRASLTAWAFVYFAAFMRLVAMGVSLIMPNDEARISQALGLGLWTLPAIVSVGLVALAVVGARRLGLGWKTQLFSYLTASVVISAIVGLDRVLAG